MLNFSKNSFKYCLIQYRILNRHQQYINSRVFSQDRSGSLICWSCGVNIPITSLFCSNCRVVQPPPNTNNYFKVFDLEESFNIDKKTLSAKYRLLQTVLHPDKFSNKSDKEKAISADYSSLVNKAYNSLQMPLSRAIHMLGLKGIKIEDQKVTDNSFLIEIMQLNEEVEDAKTPEELKTLNEKNKAVLEATGREISRCFQEAEIEKAKDYVVKMKYYNSINLHINGLLRERGIVD